MKEELKFAFSFPFLSFFDRERERENCDNLLKDDYKMIMTTIFDDFFSSPTLMTASKKDYKHNLKLFK